MASGWNNDITKIYDLSDYLAKEYKARIVNANAVAKGNLANFSHDVELRDNGLSVVFNLPDYWYYIEEGRQPTQNPGDGTVLQRIRQWIDDKGIVPVPDAKGKIPTLDSLAYAITKKIHQVGYFDLDGQHSQGKHLLRDTLENSQKTIEEITAFYGSLVTEPIIDELNSLSV